MRIERHEDIRAWQFARELETRVFAFTDKPHVARHVDFCRDIRRSAASAPRNISEGFGRFWPGEFAHKLRIAIGELEETQDHLSKGLELKCISAAQHQDMIALADRAMGAAIRFAEYLESAGPEWKKDYAARKRAEYRAKRASQAGNLPPNEGTTDSEPELEN